MYSVLMTGYMFRNAQYRLELQQSLEQVALPDTQEKKVIEFYLNTHILYMILYFLSTGFRNKRVVI